MLQWCFGSCWSDRLRQALLSSLSIAPTEGSIEFEGAHEASSSPRRGCCRATFHGGGRHRRQCHCQPHPRCYDSKLRADGSAHPRADVVADTHAFRSPWPHESQAPAADGANGSPNVHSNRSAHVAAIFDTIASTHVPAVIATIVGAVPSTLIAALIDTIRATFAAALTHAIGSPFVPAIVNTDSIANSIADNYPNDLAFGAADD